MPKIEIEISKIINLEQEFMLQRIIDEMVARINFTGLRVLSHNYPKWRKDEKNK